MKIESINHFTINIKDVKANEHFYGDVLGLKKLNEVNMGDHYIRYYELPDGARLELVEYLYQTKDADVTEVDRGIYRHLALHVDDIMKAEQELRAEGIEITEGPAYTDKLGCYFMLFTDPNGCQLEFTQIK